MKIEMNNVKCYQVVDYYYYNLMLCYIDHK